MYYNTLSADLPRTSEAVQDDSLATSAFVDSRVETVTVTRNEGRNHIVDNAASRIVPTMIQSGPRILVALQPAHSNPSIQHLQPIQQAEFSKGHHSNHPEHVTEHPRHQFSELRPTEYRVHYALEADLGHNAKNRGFSVSTDVRVPAELSLLAGQKAMWRPRNISVGDAFAMNSNVFLQCPSTSFQMFGQWRRIISPVVVRSQRSNYNNIVNLRLDLLSRPNLRAARFEGPPHRVSHTWVRPRARQNVCCNFAGQLESMGPYADLRLILENLRLLCANEPELENLILLEGSHAA
ncbi:hypothetical protein BDW22DRAFT_1348761 [Trametopsis cervina]|nr:hypothetical protein BDW22DRAFT_1348761 [Trametopsis cervina]